MAWVGDGRNDGTKFPIFSGQQPIGNRLYGDVYLFSGWPRTCGQAHRSPKTGIVVAGIRWKLN